MDNYQISFTDIHKAELVKKEVREPDEYEVLVKTEYTVISAGTERACILGMNNTPKCFPMSLGYRKSCRRQCRKCNLFLHKINRSRFDRASRCNHKQ